MCFKNWSYLSKGVIMGIGMIPFVILIIYLAIGVGSALEYHHGLWRGVNIEAISFIMGAFIILLITPIMLFIVHRKDSRRPEEEKKIFTKPVLIRGKIGGIVLFILGIMLWGGGIPPHEIPFSALFLFLFIALLIAFTIVPLRKMLGVFIPLCFIPLLLAMLYFLFSEREIGEGSLRFVAALLFLPLMVLGLAFIGVLIGTFSGYVTQKKETGVFTKSDMWITALFVSLIPLTLASLGFTILGIGMSAFHH